MKMKKLDHKSGKLLVFGGVYSNLQALEALQEKAKELNILPENIFCTGDIVGYCAQPEEVVRSVKAWGVHSIAGNVELQLAEGKDDCGCDFDNGSRCDLFSKQWYPYAQKALSKEAIEWVKELPEFLSFEWHGKKIGLVHGSYFATAEFIFKSTDWKVKEKNFQAMNADLILAGHCGLPFSEEKSGMHWINPGVIGMPANDADPRVWFATLEIEGSGKLKVTHHRLAYDHNTANALMVEKQLPQAYAKTILSGIWDNCDILPPKETAQQGEAISLEHIVS